MYYCTCLGVKRLPFIVCTNLSTCVLAKIIPLSLQFGAEGMRKNKITRKCEVIKD